MQAMYFLSHDFVKDISVFGISMEMTPNIKFKVHYEQTFFLYILTKMQWALKYLE